MQKFAFLLVFALLAAVAFAGGAGEQTQVEVDLEDTVYISPDASPGTQDSVEIPIRVNAGSGNQNVIVAYTVEVTNEAGQVVWSEAVVDESEQPGFFTRLFQNLGLAQRQTTVLIPEETEWSGTYQNSEVGADGQTVPDGEYRYVLTVALASEETVTTEPQTVVVDNTPPQATASVNHRYFSPDGDGRQDTVTLTQSTSSEDEWVGTISAQGESEFDVTWQGEADAEFVWDGRTPDGEMLPTDAYVYTLSATDRAGNQGSIDPIEVVLDVDPRPLDIIALPEGSALAFSPNDDGSRDTLQIAFGDQVSTELLDQATLTVRDSNGREIGTIDITDELGGVLEITGYLDEEQTERAPEGTYELEAEARYLNGMIVTAGPVDGVLDVTPPSGSVSADDRVFSPEGDGLNDTILILQDLSDDATWEGAVYEAGGEVLEVFPLGSDVPEQFAWDGTNLEGEPVPDGTYAYGAIGIDPAGNEARTNQIQVSIDRSETTIDFDLSREYFSPNGDGQGDVVIIEPVLSVPTGVESYEFAIVDRDGNEILSGSDEGELPPQFEWNGRDGAGDLMEEGEYFPVLDLVYEKGNEPRAVGPAMIVDNTIPQISLRANRDAILQGDEQDDERVEFIPFVDPMDEISSYTGRILSANGRVIREITGDQPRGTAYWDGTAQNGQRASDGYYVGVLQVEHRNGTVREARTGRIAVGDVADAEAPRVTLQLSPQTFTPDGDGEADTVLIVLSIVDESEIGDWTIDIVDPDGDVFFSYSDSGQAPASIEWDGRSADGELVEMAQDYQVNYEVSDVAGNTATGGKPLTVGVLTEERFGLLRIVVDDIIFEGFTARYTGWDRSITEQNENSLDTIARAMEMFPELFIEVHGHAVSLLYENDRLAAQEQEQTLLPLSRERAQVIRQALVDRGVDPERIAIEAWGSDRPIIPFSDEDDRFENRRVEFYLDEE
ncbi:MAG: OmpA family protein [Spirochaetales bacterium]